MTTDVPNNGDPTTELLWALAVAKEEPVPITAGDIENILNILFLNETASFQISEAISKMQVGDLAGSKSANSAAVETTKRALEASKNLRLRMMSKALGEGHGGPYPMSLNVIPYNSDGALQAALDALRLSSKGPDTANMSEVDAKIAAAEARTDTKFAELLAELRLLNQRLDHVEKSTSGMRSTVIGTGIGVVAIVIAVMAYGAQWFGLGMDTQQISERAVANAIVRVQPQIDTLSAGYASMNTKLDQLLSAVNDRPDPQAAPQANPNQ